MGVKGLWPILHPCARPIELSTLNCKRLAVDASIWIYQFLKAVRDKEGNALRNSHIVGFFRRICKLLYHGIKPVFVFDGAAPSLKRQTLQGRKRRREGRYDDAIRTAGKLLAVQMQRRAEEEEARKKRQVEGRGVAANDDEDVVREGDTNVVYVDELGMSRQQIQQTRKFRKTDAYHLPELINGIEGMGRPEDPRIMSVEELEEYARQFNSGEDINLYDFSKIDFNGEFFKSLPAGDRYNILNAARLRSRMRMGLGKDQLEDMFPDRMAFSRFQIERVRERNDLTQRLMNLNGMNDGANVGIQGGRIAGEHGREYVLVKNDGVEGGWALGVVSMPKDAGEVHKPIDVDALHTLPDKLDESSSDDDFEDVPIEGLNRLPKIKDGMADITRRRRELYTSRAVQPAPETTDSLFVDDQEMPVGHDSEEEDLQRAIAMSLGQTHHSPAVSDAGDIFEDVELPTYEQRAVEPAKPIPGSGRGVAQLVNSRANASVPKRRANSTSSEEGDDLQAALAASRLQHNAKKAKMTTTVPTFSNVKNPFDGPLPFEKLNFRPGGIFGKKVSTASSPSAKDPSADDDIGGGFTVADSDDEFADPTQPKSEPIPPWLAQQDADIRADAAAARARDIQTNDEDRRVAEDEARRWKREFGPVEILSDEEGGSDVEILGEEEAAAVKKKGRNGRGRACAVHSSVVDLTNETAGPSRDVVAPSSDKSTTADRPSKALSSKATLTPPTQEPSTSEASPSHKPTLQPTGADLALDLKARPPPTRIPDNRHASPRAVSKAFKGTDLMGSGSEMVEAVGNEKMGALEMNGTGEVDEAVEKVDGQTDDIKGDGSGELDANGSSDEEVDWSESDYGDGPETAARNGHEWPGSGTGRPRKEESMGTPLTASRPPALQTSESAFDRAAFDADIVGDIDFDDFSDPDDEELLANLALEAEEHARFTSQFNHRSAAQNQEEYERELKSLRSQQKKDRRDADDVTQTMVTECQALLGLFGLPYITAEGEAEAQCAELVNLGLVDGVVTDDCDVFLFGGTRVYKNMFNSNKYVECYLASDIEKELSMSRSQLIAVAQLLGSDYTEGLPGIGPVTALEILSEFPDPKTGLQDFKDWWEDAQAHPGEAIKATGFRKKFHKSQGRKLFLPPGFPSQAVADAYLNPNVDHSNEAFQWGVIDLNMLRTYLIETIGWTQERVDEVLVPVIRDMNKRDAEGTQSNITRFFSGGVGAGARDRIESGRKEGASKRMKDAVNRLKARRGGQSTKPVHLQATFGEEAARWARKNELSAAAEERKMTTQRGKGKGKGNGRGKAAAEVVEDEDFGD